MLEVSPEWTEDRHVLPQNTSMEYDIRVTCDSNYYGGGCADLCRPRDDGFGHYTCSSNGDIVCLSGWQGQYCTKRKYHGDTATQNGALARGDSLWTCGLLIDTSCWTGPNEDGAVEH